MKKNCYDLSVRTSEGLFLPVDEDTYITGLLNVIGILYDNLKLLLDEEGRNFGIMKSYEHSIETALSRLNIKEADELTKEIYERITYLLKQVFRGEYRRLLKKRLSPADSIICIMRKVLSILEERYNYTNLRELKTIKKIVDKIYDRIKSWGKGDYLFKLANTIRDCIDGRTLGKYRLNSFSVSEPNPPKEKLDEKDDGVRVNVISENKIMEIEWTENS